MRSFIFLLIGKGENPSNGRTLFWNCPNLWDGSGPGVGPSCCETGDILIENAVIPSVRRGEVLALFNTGAYTFSMAGNYNRLCRPAVVLVKGGQAEVIVERQTPDDLLRGDRIPRRLARRGD